MELIVNVINLFLCDFFRVPAVTLAQAEILANLDDK